MPVHKKKCSFHVSSYHHLPFTRAAASSLIYFFNFVPNRRYEKRYLHSCLPSSALLSIQVPSHPQKRHSRCYFLFIVVFPTQRRLATAELSQIQR